ncbi:MAG: putative ATP-dependent DNA helicase [Prokaryotic dsDNA virus sp.]|nr:MAG: putative ATP-dependent DNA helicase [Prokaryotic dsDNA virus sp.]
MELRDYQQEVHDDCMSYLKQESYRGPAVINASVGAGKSVLIAAIARHCSGVMLKDRPCRALVIQRQGELCKQNSDAAHDFGVVQQSVFSASLNRKSAYYPVIFGTEGTIARSLHDTFANFPVDIIMVDECHMVDYDSDDSQFMQIIRHFIAQNPNVRILGYTGSPYRGTESIIGKFWTQMIGNISTDWLIDRGWLVPPTFGWPDGDDSEFDFSQVKTKYGSWEFDEKQLDEIVFGDPTKTQRIMAEVLHKTEDRGGVLIFCTSIRHTQEVAKALPPGSYCIITGSTPTAERMQMLDDCKSGRIKYCINVSVLTTGVNVPRWDTVVFLRPIGSLVLLTQAIGRGLRLFDGKSDCLVLDYGGVMQRLGHLYNNPILEEAEYERAKKEDEDMLTCQVCGTENSPHARRCRGHSDESEDGRCEFFWSSRECPSCGAENDPTARNCRKCQHELIDPNEKLLHRPYDEQEWEAVKGWQFRICKNNSIEVEYMLTETREDGNPKVYLNPGSKSRGAQQALKQWMSVNTGGGVGYHYGILARHNPSSAARFVLKYWLQPLNQPTHIKYRINGKGKFVVGRVKREDKKFD